MWEIWWYMVRHGEICTKDYGERQTRWMNMAIILCSWYVWYCFMLFYVFFSWGVSCFHHFPIFSPTSPGLTWKKRWKKRPRNQGFPSTASALNPWRWKALAKPSSRVRCPGACSVSVECSSETWGAKPLGLKASASVNLAWLCTWNVSGISGVMSLSYGFLYIDQESYYLYY